MSLNLTVKVAGVTHDGRQDILKRLVGDEAARIVPEPQNPYDKNALAVHIAMHDGTIAHAGYIPKELAREVAPLLDGEAVMVKIKAITGGFETYEGGTAYLGLQIRVYLEGDEGIAAPTQAELLMRSVDAIESKNNWQNGNGPGSYDDDDMDIGDLEF